MLRSPIFGQFRVYDLVKFVDRVTGYKINVYGRWKQMNRVQDNRSRKRKRLGKTTTTNIISAMHGKCVLYAHNMPKIVLGIS